MTRTLRKIAKYEIRAVLGEGGVGTVYRAYQADLHREVALKVMIAGEHASPELLKRFLREARAAASLTHPGIVPVYDVGAEGSLHYIVMELVEGGSLADLLRKGPLAPEAALRMAARLADALEEAHRKGIIHRDIKPSNILIDSRGRPRIADFGLAAAVYDSERLTRTGDILGTPWYMSPEQAFGEPHEIDARSDVYSLGAVLYEMLTGRPPFDGTNSLQVLKKIELEEPLPPSKRNPKLDPVVMRALEKDRGRRYAGAAEFAQVLREAAAGRWPAPKSRKARTTAGALALLAGGFAFGLWARGAFESAPEASVPRGPFWRGSVRRALLEAREPAERVYLAFLRYELCQGNARVSYLHPVRPVGVEKDLEALRSSDAALAELVSLTFQRRYAEAADRAPPPVTPRLRVVRGHAALRRTLQVRDDGLRAARLRALAAELEKEPDDRYVRFLRAVALARSGEKAGAEALARRLIDAPSAGFSDPYLFRAVVFDHLGAEERLVENLELAHAVDPEDPLPLCYLLAIRFVGGDDRATGNPFEGLPVPIPKDEPYPAPALLAAAAELFRGRRAEAERAFRDVRLRYGDPTAWAPFDDEGGARDLAALVLHAGEKGPRFAYAAGLLLARAGRPEAEEALRDAAKQLEAPDAAQAYLLEPDELRDMRQAIHRELAAASLRRGTPGDAVGHLVRAVEAGANAEELLEDERLEALRADPKIRELLRQK
jgi:tRNA A-37 threonylcarbamoyl transferase component Bud32